MPASLETTDPIARQRARAELAQLWDGAQRLGADQPLARAALHLEAVRRALRLWGDPALASDETRSALALAPGEVAPVARAITDGLTPDATVSVDVLTRAHAQAVAKLGADARPDAERATRLALRLFPVAALLFLIGAPIARALAPVDLAAGLTFRTSSTYAGFPAHLRFHTNEEEHPWALVDLGRPTDFSRLTVVNRGDSEQARAVPLVVEVSDDGATFREVARRTETFTTWKPSFAPQRARFVRLRVDRKSFLHLEAVRVHP